MRVVKIVVVGDGKTGKSSLITASVTNEFSSKVLETLPPLVDEPRIGQNSPTRKFIDTSDMRDPLKESKRKQALRSADVVCIVYDITRPETFDSVGSRWMPELVALNVTAPVILLGNKFDLREAGDRASLATRQRLGPLMSQYGNQIEWGFECSAKTMESVREAFARAVESVLYPSAPLFDVSSQQLSQKFLAALANIFKQVDYDRDGYITDEELLDYQRCYSPQMTLATVAKLKEVVRNFSPESAQEGKMSVDGFVLLHQFLVQNSKFQAVWELLSAFGYGTDLLLSKEYLHPDIAWKEGDVTQLGPKGFRFFMELFERFDTDRDGLLNVQEQKEFYETTPGDPFRFKGPLMCETNASAPESIADSALLALWCMKTHQTHKFTSKYLRFLGYKGPMQEAIEVVTGLGGSQAQQEYRHTYQCFVFGSVGCGKSAVLRSLVGKGARAPVDNCVVNQVHKERSTGTKYLILREYSEHETEGLFKQEDALTQFRGCDLVCLAYDVHDAASFTFASCVHEELMELGVELPFVFLACKSDLSFAEYPESAVSPTAYCTRHRLVAPLQFSRDREDTARTFNDLVDIARDPSLGTRRQSRWGRLFGFGLGAAMFSAGAFLFAMNWPEILHLLRPLFVVPQKLIKE